MTALSEYERIEATALWRAHSDAQRREVIVSIGNAMLVISDLRDEPLAHWSLTAIERANPGERPAVFHPDGDPGETLELSSDEDEMVAAIERLRKAIQRSRPRPGRLRRWSILGSVTAVAAVIGLWLPGALLSHTVAVVPEAKRAAIGTALLTRIERITGPVCGAPATRAALDRLARRTGTADLAVIPDGVAQTLALPGGTILLHRRLVEDHEAPDVAAGHILAETTRAAQNDPLQALLAHGGPRAAFRLLTTGEVTTALLDSYAEAALTVPRAPVADADLLARFDAARIPSTPYAYATDITGETVLPLIEADPVSASDTAPLMPDADWVRLQSICGG